MKPFSDRAIVCEGSATQGARCSSLTFLFDSGSWLSRPLPNLPCLPEVLGIHPILGRERGNAAVRSGACAGAWRARRSDHGAHADRTMARI